MPYLAALLAGYVIGTVPFAWLFVRWRRGFDLYAAGSTNVGATNAYETTGSRRIGAGVLVLDLLKGVLAVLAGWGVFAALGVAAADPEGVLGPRYWPGALALLGALAGHNYNALLSLRARRLAGGKGFATAAGGFGLLMPWVVVAWLVLLYVGIRAFEWRRGIRDLIPGNVVATSFVPLVAWALYGWPGALVTAAFALLTLPKHARQLGALMRAEHGVHPQEGRRAHALGRSRVERVNPARGSKNR
ncbi:MAG TPA: glycerol-3-phosphate acyltransferase [Rubricoccaceae bacterium]|nr:glycerol-3-phosphate acyltransferase [Rubricoccaceae bacterium]